MVRFKGDLHSDLDPRLLLLICLVAICEIASATLLLFARRQHYNTDDFSGEHDFNVVYQFKIAS